MFPILATQLPLSADCCRGSGVSIGRLPSVELMELVGNGQSDSRTDSVVGSPKACGLESPGMEAIGDSMADFCCQYFDNILIGHLQYFPTSISLIKD